VGQTTERARLLPTVLLISTRFVYLIAGLCSLSVAVLPLLLNARESTLFMTLWIGAMLLLVATFPWKGTYAYIAHLSALLGSIVITSVIFYRIVQPKALNFSYARLVAYPYQPSTFERVVPVLMHRLLTVLLVCSVASLLISALITFRLRNRTGSSPLTGT